MKYTIFTDGGARGNPGPSATGIIIKDTDDETVAAYGEYLGEQTNNYAEYMALIQALQKAHELGATIVHCKCDSKLVVEQLNRNWKVKEPTIQTLFLKAWKEFGQFESWTLTHIRRELNTEADAEVNKVLDAKVE
jgi:ribonuclease HI